jgi:protein-disulfide isomerase
MKSETEFSDIPTPKKSNFEAKLLAVMALVVLGGGAFLVFSNKATDAPAPRESEVKKEWTPAEFDEIFKAAKHVKGNANSPLKVIEFADAQCPSCRRTFAAFGKKLGKEIDAQFAYMHYPISGIGHDHAIPCVTAMEAAAKQNKFWEMHEALFAQQNSEANLGGEPDLSDDFIQKVAKEVGLNMTQFNTDIKDPALMRIGAESERFAMSKKIDMTPTFLYMYKGKVSVAVGSQPFLEQLKGYPGLPTPEELKAQSAPPAPK